MSVLKLGTRKSLLAWAQSSWVAREIEKASPGTQVELIGIETRGDKVLDVSLQDLSQMTGGKEFFVAEIDQALRSRAVDLTVHSMKDLSLDRPQEFVLAANPPRENPRDVALFSPKIIEKLKQGRKIRVGTSSPRRLENLPEFLKKALPFGQADLEFVEIRGNVNTRLGRVHEAEGSPKALDAVVLAFAGLIRLWKDDRGRDELSELLQGVRWMVLPLKECPAAPAQGALAIECRRGDEAVLSKIAKIHCAKTAEHVSLERELLSKWGGGCHQKFGATAISTENLSKLLFVRGKKQDGSFVENLSWNWPARPAGKLSSWDGSQWRGSEDGTETLNIGRVDFRDKALFVAHSRAVNFDPALLAGSRVWTSGTSSWFALAEKGVWIEGSAEGFGFETLSTTLHESVLQLPDDWSVLTHEGAAEGWGPKAKVFASYRVTISYPMEAKASLASSTDVFWSSGSQFHAFKDFMPNARHACGPGKTAAELKTFGVAPVVFPSVEEWRKWITNTLQKSV